MLEVQDLPLNNRSADELEAENIKYNVARVVRLASGAFALYSHYRAGDIDLVKVGTIEEIAPHIPRWYMKRPVHCTAPSGEECWECTQPWLFRTTERRIKRAILLVKGRAERVTNEVESISKLDWAIHKLYELHNSQWRDMVREPFKFQPAKSTAGKIKSIDLADLGL